MRSRRDDEFEEFVCARCEDLHHDAYQLTAAQETAEHLVVAVLSTMRREGVDLAQAGAQARLRMACAAVRDDTPTDITDVSQLPAQFRVLAELSPRQRAILLLHVVDHYDERAIARALRLSTRTATEALRSIPYDGLPGTSPHSGELRSLLDDFGDLVTAPGAATTLAEVHDAPPPPHRPWWTYAAALLVIVLTTTSLVLTQRWHDDWLRTPEGLNHTHGTNFPAYTQGYKLVAIHDVAPGPAETLDVGTQDGLVIECAKGATDETSIARLSSQLIGDFEVSCSAVGRRQHLTPVMGETTLAIDDFSRKHWPIAVYRKLPWSQYPVARTNFTVEHDKTLLSIRPTDGHGNPVRPAVPGRILTLHGTADHPNGTFTETVTLPVVRSQTMPVFSALLSPTTTGQFQLLVVSQSPVTNCGSPDQLFYAGRQDYKTCSLVDAQVPQVEYGDAQGNGTAQIVRFTVKHALGPWTLQLVYDVYRTDNTGQIIAP